MPRGLRALYILLLSLAAFKYADRAVLSVAAPVIAAEFQSGKGAGAYIAAGLVLFVLTFIVNAAARYVVNRRKEFS